MASVTQVRRLLNLLEKLRSDEAYNARQLAEQLGVSRRTMFRDLRSLEKLGVRAEFDDRNQRYVVTMSEELSKAAEISPAELQSLLALSEGHEAASRSTKNLGVQVGIVAGSGEAGMSSALNVLASAIVDGRLVELVLASGQAFVREPIRLINVAGRWNLVANDPTRQKTELVDLEQIQTAKSTDEPTPSRTDEETAKLVEAACGRTGTGDAREVAVIRFSKDGVAAVTGQKRMPVQDVQWESHGGLTVRTPMIDERQLTDWVLSFGRTAEVLEPSELRDAVAREVEAMCEIYNGTLASV